MAVTIFEISCKQGYMKHPRAFREAPVSSVEQAKVKTLQKEEQLQSCVVAQCGALVGGKTYHERDSPMAASGGHPMVFCVSYHMLRSLLMSFWHKKHLCTLMYRVASQLKHILANVCKVSRAGRALMKCSPPPTSPTRTCSQAPLIKPLDGRAAENTFGI